MKKSYLALCLPLVTCMANAANKNPASIDYVNEHLPVAGNGISILGNIISTAPFVKVGDIYQGGVVFFVDETGRHGLIVAIQDFPSGSASTNTVPWAQSDYGVGTEELNGIYAGSSASTIASAAQFNPAQGNLAHCPDPADSQNSTAFCLAHNCKMTQPTSTTVTTCDPSTGPTSTPCYNDFYIGSYGELLTLFQSSIKATVNATLSQISGATPLGDYYYWSSTEDDISSDPSADEAYAVNGATGALVSDVAKTCGSTSPPSGCPTQLLKTRPIRRF